MAHILILDIGKTNKKLLVFDQDYQIVFEHMDVLAETVDEDGFPCEDLLVLNSWILERVTAVINNPAFEIRAINFSAYGASFVLLDQQGEPVRPLYNYLKPIDQRLKDQFFESYGGDHKISLETSSPSLGLLNSGLQLYRLKFQQEEKFNLVKFALHLPQYCSYLFTREARTEISSLGCHTMLWNFAINQYHAWVVHENIDQLFPPIQSANTITSIQFRSKSLVLGTGLHDSSAALIPYLKSKEQPFILLSTGTWCIALNPFNDTPLTSYELKQDCLCYLTYEGNPVKASRLFLGQEYEEQVHSLSKHYHQDIDYFQSIQFNKSYFLNHGIAADLTYIGSQGLWRSGFEKRNWFELTADRAYHILIHDLVKLQLKSIRLIQHQATRELYVDGGFAKNEVFMYGLAHALPDLRVYSAMVSQASALGAAMVLHPHWNRGLLPVHPIQFRYFDGG